MGLYETTFFSKQKQKATMLGYRGKINERLSELRTLAATDFGSYEAVRTGTGRANVLAACGNPAQGNSKIFEVGIGGEWRIFFSQGYSGGAVVLCIGHLVGNGIDLPR